MDGLRFGEKRPVGASQVQKLYGWRSPSITGGIELKQKKSLEAIDNLFKSLQQHAFSGKLFTEKAAAAAQQELFADWRQ
jgi:hypothetical protein